jgi:hypothetical protein
VKGFEEDGRKDPELLKAIRARTEAKRELDSQRAAYIDSKIAYEYAVKVVEEILSEYSGELPVLAWIHGQANGETREPVAKPKRRKAQP